MMMMLGRGEKASERAGSLISRLHPAPLAPPLTTRHHRHHHYGPRHHHCTHHIVTIVNDIGTTIKPEIIAVIIITIPYHHHHTTGLVVRLTVTHLACLSVYEAVFNWRESITVHSALPEVLLVTVLSFILQFWLVQVSFVCPKMKNCAVLSLFWCTSSQFCWS